MVEGPILAIDLGTTKICALAAYMHKEQDHKIEILGMATGKSSGIRGGTVIDLETTESEVHKVVEEVLMNTNCKIKKAYVSLAGPYLKSFNHSGSTTINSRRKVSTDDIVQAIEHATHSTIPEGMEIIHQIPKGYRLDGTFNPLPPTNLTGNLLEVDVHLVASQNFAHHNVAAGIQGAGIRLERLVLSQIASSMAVLTKDEKMTGVALVDIGGGTTDLVVYYNGFVVHTEVIPFGGSHLTNILAKVFPTTETVAEDLKIKHGHAIERSLGEREVITIDRIPPRRPVTIKRRELANILEPHIERLLDAIRNSLRKQDLINHLYAGMVFTGGTPLMEGLVQKCQEYLNLETRLGTPNGIPDLPEDLEQPIYATAVGLLHYAREEKLKALPDKSWIRTYKRVKQFISHII